MKLISAGAFCLVTTWTLFGFPAQTPAPAPAANAAAERFEVSSIRAVRPTLVKTVAALQRQNAAEAKEAFEAFDSAWNGIEVYISTRNPDMYSAIETNYESRIMQGLNSASPDMSALLPDAQAMLAKFDEAVAMVEQGAPLNRFYDDVARLRIVRAHIREINPELKAGNIEKARQSFGAFSDSWDGIEELVKARSREAYDAIEKGMIDIERALMPSKPDVDQVSALVTAVTDRYNAIVEQVLKDARTSR
jgi:hypothetical protein